MALRSIFRQTQNLPDGEQLTKHLRDYFNKGSEHKLNPRVRGLIYGLLLLTIVGSFYYFVYMGQNEVAFIQKRYRSLAELGNSLVGRYDEMRSIPANEPGKVAFKNNNGGSILSVPVGDSVLSWGLPIRKSDENYDVLEYGSLLGPVIPSALFDHVILFKGSEVVYHNLPNGFRSDSLPHILNHLKNPNNGTLHISEVAFHPFLHNFDFSRALRPPAIGSPPDDKGIEEEVRKQVGGQWSLVGLVSLENAGREISRVNIWFIVILATIIFFILACLPVLKLLLQGEVELIRVRDATLSTLSLVTGTPLVFVILLGLFEYLDFHHNESKRDLKHLGQMINESFLEEADQMIHVMDLFDENKGKEAPQLKSIYQSSVYPGFNETARISLNKNGEEDTATYSPLASATMGNIRKRDYFRRVANGDLWRFKLKNDSSRDIYVQSVVSWISGYQEAVISAKSLHSDTSVVMISSAMHSVINTVLPPPYRFAIIDDAGKVLFHSNASRNGNENFLDELDSDDKRHLLTHMRIQRSSFFTSRYWGNRIHGYVRPLDQLPLHVVTFYEMASTRLYISEVMTSTLVFHIMSVVALLLVCACTIILHRRSSRFLRIRHYAHDWLRPKKEKTALYLTFSIVFLLFSLWSSFHLLKGSQHYPQYYTFDIMIPAISFFLVYFVLSDHPSWRKACQLVVLTLLSYLLYHYLDSLQLSKGPRLLIWSPSIIYVTLLLLRPYLEDIFTWQPSLPKWATFVLRPLKWAGGLLLVVMFLALAFVGFILYAFHWWVEQRAMPWLERLFKCGPFEFKVGVYKTFIFLWIVSCMLLPIINLFIKANVEEQYLWERYAQLHVAKDFHQKVEKLSDYYYVSTQERRDTPLELNPFLEQKIFAGNYFESAYPSWKHLTEEKTQSVHECLREQQMNTTSRLRFRRALRPLYGELSHYLSAILETEGLVDDEYQDYLWAKHKGSDRVHFLARDLDAPIASVVGLHFEKAVGERFLESKAERIFLGIVCVLFLLFFLFLLHIVVNALFAFKFRKVWNRIVDKGTHKDAEKDRICFCILTPGCKFKLPKGAYIIDLNLGLSGPEITALLKAIGDARKNYKQVFLVSHYYPITLMEDYMETLRSGDDEAEVERFITLFAGLPQYFIGCERHDREPELNEVARELRLLEWQAVDYSRYAQIWHTLPNREKYVLYDLAVDGFLNIKGVRPITNLMYKGLIKWRDDTDKTEWRTEGLNLFDPAFRDFILRFVAKDYGKQLQTEIGQRSTWGSLSMVIYILMAAAVVFVALSEPDFFHDFSSFWALFAGAATLVPGISALFSSGKGDTGA